MRVAVRNRVFLHLERRWRWSNRTNILQGSSKPRGEYNTGASGMCCGTCGGIVGLPDSRVTSLLLSRLDEHDGTMMGVERPISSHRTRVCSSITAVLATLAGVKRTAWPVDMVAAAACRQVPCHIMSTRHQPLPPPENLTRNNYFSVNEAKPIM